MATLFVVAVLWGFEFHIKIKIEILKFIVAVILLTHVYKLLSKKNTIRFVRVPH